jgi:hypothetical protein
MGAGLVGVKGARSQGRGGDACLIGFKGQILSGVCWDSIMRGMGPSGFGLGLLQVVELSAWWSL